MRLAEGDEICGAIAISPDEEKTLVTMSDNGVGKRSEFSDFAAKHRGGKGMRCQKLGGKAGEKLVGIAAVREEDDLILIASDGKLVRVHAQQISLVGRNASGIFVMRPEEGESLISFQRVVGEKEIEKDAEAAVESDEVLEEGEEVPDLPETEEPETEEETDEADE